MNLMKKGMIVLTAMTLFLSSGCSKKEKSDRDTSASESSVNIIDEPEELQRLKDEIYAELNEELPLDEYVIEDIKISYMSSEDAQQVTTDSKVIADNTVDEFDKNAESDRLVIEQKQNGGFDLDKVKVFDQETVIKTIKNIAIGSGVILVYVTITVLSGGTNQSVMVAILSSSAELAKLPGIAAVVTGLASGITRYVKSHDIRKSFKNAIEDASEAFKWVAIAEVALKGAENMISSFKDYITKIPSWQESEAYVAKKLKATSTQVSYLNGKVVTYFTEGASRIDALVGNVAVEIKNYDLKNNFPQMLGSLKKEISQRIKNLPPDFTQKIVIDVRKRGYSKAFLKEVLEMLQTGLADIYPNIPIEFVGAPLWPF